MSQNIKRFVTDLKISTKPRECLNLDIEIFSYDKNTWKLIFNLSRDNGLELDLTDAAVRFFLTYELKNKKVSIEEPGVIEVGDKPAISYTIPEMLRGYDGTVKAAIYIDLKDNERIDIQNIRFLMSKSLIDADIQVNKESYFASFESVLKDVNDTGETVISEMQGKDKAVEEAAQSEIGKIIEISTGVQNAADEETSKIKAVLPTVEKLAESESTKISDVTRDITAVSDKAKTDMSASVKGVTDKATEAGSSIELAVAGVNGLATTEKENIQKVINGVNTVASDEEIKIKDVINNVNVVANTEKTKIQQVLPTVQANVAEVQTKIDDASAQIEALIDSGVLTEKDLINSISGDIIQLKFKSDFSNKTRGSLINNPNIVTVDGRNVLSSPTTGNEVLQTSYDNIAKLDNISSFQQAISTGNMIQVKTKWNVVEMIDRAYPTLLANLGLTNLNEKTSFIKSRLSKVNIKNNGFGSSPIGNNIISRLWFDNTSWSDDERTNSKSYVSSFDWNLTQDDSINIIPNILSSDGYIYSVIYSDPADGVVATATNIDYLGIEFNLDIQMSDFWTQKREHLDLAERVKIIEDYINSQSSAN